MVTEPTVDTSKFDTVLLEAIDETLSVYGEGTKSAFFAHLEKSLNILKREIPVRIDEFSKALEDLFGQGARYMEILVLKNLHSKLGVAWEVKAANPWVLADFTFREYVSFVKKYFEDADKYEEQMSIFVNENEAREIYR